RHTLEDRGFAVDPGWTADPDRPAARGFSRPASRPANRVKVRVDDQARPEDGVLADHNRAGGHQPGAVDFDPVTDLDAGVRAKGEQGGAARRIADGYIGPEGDPAPATDMQPQRAAESWSESMSGIAMGKV